MLRKVMTVTAMVGLLFVAQANADELTPEKRQDIVKLFQVTKALESTNQVVPAIWKAQLPLFRRAVPNVSQEELSVIRDLLVESFRSASDELIDMMIPIYAKNFTHQEVEDLLAFYQSPVGMKTAELMPVLFQEFMAEGQRWAQKVFVRIQPEIEARLNEIRNCKP